MGVQQLNSFSVTPFTPFQVVAVKMLLSLEYVMHNCFELLIDFKFTLVTAG